MANRLGLAMILAGAAFAGCAASAQTPTYLGGKRPSVEVNLGAIDELERGTLARPGKTATGALKLKAPPATTARATAPSATSPRVSAPAPGVATLAPAFTPPPPIPAPVPLATPLNPPAPEPATANVSPAPLSATPRQAPAASSAPLANVQPAASPVPPPAPAAAPPRAAPAQTAALQQPAAAPANINAAGDLLIGFAGSDATLSGDAERQLAALAQRLASTEDRIQLRGFASASGTDAASGARRLSLSRALAVRSYLIDKGVRSTRIEVRALGQASDGGPPDRVDVATTAR